MCDYKILSHNQTGYIILCNTCGHYQLAFGTMAVTLEPKYFKSFCKQANHLKTNFDCNGFEKQKRISLNIFSPYITMILSYSELLQLNELLDEAEFDCEIEKVLQDLNVMQK